MTEFIALLDKSFGFVMAEILIFVLLLLVIQQPILYCSYTALAIGGRLLLKWRHKRYGTNQDQRKKIK